MTEEPFSEVPRQPDRFAKPRTDPRIRDGQSAGQAPAGALARWEVVPGRDPVDRQGPRVQVRQAHPGSGWSVTERTSRPGSRSPGASVATAQELERAVRLATRGGGGSAVAFVVVVGQSSEEYEHDHD